MLQRHYTQHKNFVPPVNDYQAGRNLYRQGKRRHECGNDAQRAGWDAAYERGRQQYFDCMIAESMEVA